jgi:hypothetical protein
MIIQQYRIYRQDLQANPNLLYVFGDNEQRVGLGGQAKEMRGEPNACGVATLKAPGQFWTEPMTPIQCRVIDADLARVVRHLAGGGHVIWPLEGIGTGLAYLEQSAPSTFRHLQARVAQLPHINALTWSHHLSAVEFAREVFAKLSVQPEGIVSQ